MTVIRMSVAIVTASLAAKISLCAVIVYNHHLGQHIWHYIFFITALLNWLLGAAAGKVEHLMF